MPNQHDARAERIAGNVRAELGRRKWSTRRLALAAGIEERTLHRRLAASSPTPFRVDELDRIAEVLDLTAAELFGER